MALKTTAPLVLVLAIIYQYVLKDLIFTTIGLSRDVRPVSDFPFTCRKIEHTSLEGCEDLYLDGTKRMLYAACSNSDSRKAYQPSMERLDVAGRKGTDHFTVIDIDEDKTFKELKTSVYKGALGDNSIDLHGFDVEEIDDAKLRFWVVNHRPPVGIAGELLDTSKVGLNSTVEVFEHVRGSSKLDWVKTYANAEIRTPNRVAATGKGGFYMTNDQSGKVGLRRAFDPLIGGGDLIHCGASTCKAAIPGTLLFPNGLTKSHHDGLIYVPSSLTGIVKVYAPEANNTLRLVEDIHFGYPLDNLSVDENGDIWAAGFPKLLALAKGFDNPRGTPTPPSTVLRARITGEGYKVDKVIEDRDGEVLPAATSVVHDVKTGRLFLAGHT